MNFPMMKGTEMTRSAVANGDMRWTKKSSLPSLEKNKR
jgi:hypothetical protein